MAATLRVDVTPMAPFDVEKHPLHLNAKDPIFAIGSGMLLQRLSSTDSGSAELVVYDRNTGARIYLAIYPSEYGDVVVEGEMIAKVPKGALSVPAPVLPTAKRAPEGTPSPATTPKVARAPVSAPRTAAPAVTPTLAAPSSPTPAIKAPSPKVFTGALKK